MQQPVPAAQPIVPPPANIQQQQTIQQQTIQQQTIQQQRPAPIPQLPTPPPRVRGVIPKNPNAASPPVQGPVAAQTPEVEL
jgi:hypothetical protein